MYHSPRSAADEGLTKRYTLSSSVRVFLLLAITIGSLLALLVAVDILIIAGLVLTALFVYPDFVRVDLLPRIIQYFGLLGVVGLVAAGIASLLAGATIALFMLNFGLVTPIEIYIYEIGYIHFQSMIRTIIIRGCDIESVRTGEWYDFSRVFATIHHKNGELTMVNRFRDFVDFIETIRRLFPAVQIDGF
jgi:hypothetical protein